MGKLESIGGEYAAALEKLGRCRVVLEALWQKHPDAARYQSSLADCYSEIGIAQAKLGMADESLAILGKARAIQQGLIDLHPEKTAYKQRLAEILNVIGFAQYTRKDNDDALKTFHEVQDICLALMKDISSGSKPAQLLNLLALSQHNIGSIHKQNGSLEEALPFFEEALKSRSDLADSHPSVTRYREKLGVSYMEIAELERSREPERQGSRIGPEGRRHLCGPRAFRARLRELSRRPGQEL